MPDRTVAPTLPARPGGAMRPGEVVALGFAAAIYLGVLASIFLV